MLTNIYFKVFCLILYLITFILCGIYFFIFLVSKGFLFLLGFKLKDFLHDNETLSEFLEKNATLPKHAVRQIVEANVNLEKVNELNLKILQQPNH